MPQLIQKIQLCVITSSLNQYKVNIIILNAYSTVVSFLVVTNPSCIEVRLRSRHDGCVNGTVIQNWGG